MAYVKKQWKRKPLKTSFAIDEEDRLILENASQIHGSLGKAIRFAIAQTFGSTGTSSQKETAQASQA
jgi:hypothetical protein